MFQVSIRVISSIATSIYNLFCYREVTLNFLNKLTHKLNKLRKYYINVM